MFMSLYLRWPCDGPMTCSGCFLACCPNACWDKYHSSEMEKEERKWWVTDEPLMLRLDDEGYIYLTVYFM